jgi:hypothetical protein
MPVAAVFWPVVLRLDDASLRQLRHATSRVRQRHRQLVRLGHLRRRRRMPAGQERNLRHRWHASLRRRLSVGRLRRSSLCGRTDRSLRELRHPSAHLQHRERHMVQFRGLHERRCMRAQCDADLWPGRIASLRRQLSVGHNLQRTSLPRCGDPSLRQLWLADARLQRRNRHLVALVGVRRRGSLHAVEDASLRRWRHASLR